MLYKFQLFSQRQSVPDKKITVEYCIDWLLRPFFYETTKFYFSREYYKTNYPVYNNYYPQYTILIKAKFNFFKNHRWFYIDKSKTIEL